MSVRSPTEGDRDADVAERHASLPAGEEDRQSVEEEHEDEQPRAPDVDRLDARLGGRQLVRLHQRDRPGGVRQLCERAGRKPERGSDLDEQLVEIERNHAVAGRDAVPGLVLEHVDQLLVSDRAGGDEGLLDARALEEKLDALRRGRLERAGDRRTESLEVRRQPLADGLADVDVRVQRVDRVRRERRLCTCGSWMIWVVAFVHAVLSSICRFTHVVRTETSMSTEARTTSTQTRMRRPRVSEAGALAAAGCFGSLAAGAADGAATPAASREARRAASSHPGDTAAV